VVNLRGTIVPIIDLRIKFNQAEISYDQYTVVIIVDIHERTTGIVVDGVSDVLTLTPAQIKPAPTLSGGVETDYIRGLGSRGPHADPGRHREADERRRPRGARRRGRRRLSPSNRPRAPARGGAPGRPSTQSSTHAQQPACHPARASALAGRLPDLANRPQGPHHVRQPGVRGDQRLHVGELLGAAQPGAPSGHAARGVRRPLDVDPGRQVVGGHRQEPPQERRPLLGAGHGHADARGGRIIGYTSVRSMATREQIDAAEAAYRRFRENRAAGLAIRDGAVVRTGVAGLLGRLTR
jgi:hypothetical protein